MTMWPSTYASGLSRSVDDWVQQRNTVLGVEHGVVRADELMTFGASGLSEYVIRPAESADLRPIRALGERVLPDVYDPITPPGYAEMLLTEFWNDAAHQASIDSPDEELIVAESPLSGVVGVAHTAPYRPGAVIMWRLYVVSAARGRGIGRALVAELLRRCPPGTTTFITEYVSANRAAAAFYAGQGFVPSRHERLPFRDHEVTVTFAERPIKVEG